MGEKSRLRTHLESLVTNPPLLTFYATACCLVIAVAYNFGFWRPINVSRLIFPIQFWSISDLVSASLWAVAPAIILTPAMLVVLATMLRIPAVLALLAMMRRFIKRLGLTPFEIVSIGFLVLFAATLFLAGYFGNYRASKIIEGRSYVEIGPPEEIRKAVGVIGPYKLLALNSSGYLALASCANTVVFIRSDTMKGAWFRQTNLLCNAEQRQ